MTRRRVKMDEVYADDIDWRATALDLAQRLAEIEKIIKRENN